MTAIYYLRCDGLLNAQEWHLGQITEIIDEADIPSDEFTEVVSLWASYYWVRIRALGCWALERQCAMPDHELTRISRPVEALSASVRRTARRHTWIESFLYEEDNNPCELGMAARRDACRKLEAVLALATDTRA